MYWFWTSSVYSLGNFNIFLGQFNIFPIFVRNMKVSLARYLLMLTVPLVGSLIAAIFYAFGGTTTETIVIDELLKASLNDYIDWEKSIYIIGPNNEVTNLFTCKIKLIYRCFGLHPFLALLFVTQSTYSVA
jgi:hypothetical protein